MWPAALRAASAAAPSLDALRPRGDGVVALRCTQRGCTACAEFEGEGDRDRFEAALGAAVVPWDCAAPARRALALAAGVRTLPAYVLLRAHGAPQVVVPP